MKGFKRIVVMAFALSLALAVAGYADELAARVTSEEEIPVWNREEVSRWHPGWMSQISR